MSFVAAFAAGLLGAMGLGGGGVLLLWLASAGVPQAEAQGINLLFILPVGLLGLWMHRKSGLADRAAATPLLLGGLPGVIAGSLLCFWIPQTLLSRLFGWFIIAVGIREAVLGITFLHKKRTNRNKKNNYGADGEK